MDTLQIRSFDSLDVEEPVLAPESDLRDLAIQGVDSEGDLVMGEGVMDFEQEVIERDPPIGVDASGDSETEDVFGGLEGWFHRELSEEGFFLIESSLESEVRDFQCGTVDLFVVIPVDFVIENSLGGSDVGDLFSHTGSHEPVLKPAVGAFDFPLRLGRECIGDPHIAVIQDLFPLGIDVVSEEVMRAPDGISPLDKSEDGVGVHIVGERKAIGEERGFQSPYVSPGGLLCMELRIEHEAATVIE